MKLIDLVGANLVPEEELTREREYSGRLKRLLDDLATRLRCLHKKGHNEAVCEACAIVKRVREEANR